VTADTLLIVLVAVVMVIGVAGTVLPILPGLGVIWVAAVAYGILGGFSTAGWIALAMITVLAIIGTASMLYLPQRSAASVGVPWWGQLLALGLAIAGFFVIPVIGAPLGFAMGILVATIMKERHILDGLVATWSTLKSMLLASGIQFSVGLAMMAIWVIWVWAA